MITRHKCQNCSKEWEEKYLIKDIKDIFQRVAPGEPMPSGECPECGVLCHPTNVPVMLDKPDFSIVKRQAQEYINELTKPDGGWTKDAKEYMFEAVMKAYFGSDVWDRINKHDRDY